MAIRFAKEVLWPVLLLAFTYQALGEAYELFNDDVNKKVNWIWLKDRSMTVAWNVKYFMENVNRILEALAVYLAFKDDRLNERRDVYCDMARLYLVYRGLDIIFYFINFKTDYYWIIFVVLFIFEMIFKRKSLTKPAPAKVTNRNHK